MPAGQWDGAYHRWLGREGDVSSALTSLAVPPPPHPIPRQLSPAPFTKCSIHKIHQSLALFFSSFFSPCNGQFALMSFIKQEARRRERVAAAAINIWKTFQKNLTCLRFKCQINKNLHIPPPKKKIHPSKLSTSRRGHLLGRSRHYRVTHSSFITSLQPLCTFTLYNPACLS